ANKAGRLADLGHHIVAGVDAKGASNAGKLLTVADVDPHRADVDAGKTVDAVACFGLGRRGSSAFGKAGHRQNRGTAARRRLAGGGAAKRQGRRLGSPRLGGPLGSGSYHGGGDRLGRATFALTARLTPPIAIG